MADGNLQPTTTTSTKGAESVAAKKRGARSAVKTRSTSKKPAPKAGSSGAKGNSTLNAGAQKGGSGGRYVFDLYDIERIAAGGNAGSKQHYANTRAALVEGKNVQVGLAFEKRGCGARPHTHPNEQFNFVVKGTLKVDVGDKKGMLVPTGSVAYFPANVVHRSIATPDEDVVFFVVKDLSHGITGTPVDQRKGGAHFEPEVRSARARGTVRKNSA
jgi:quercetin dioxygenase-like cupin family protein